MNAHPLKTPSLSVDPFAAHADERIYAAAVAPARGVSRRVAIGAAALLYALLAASVLYETRFPPPEPEPEETPIEIVTEPPPPPPPQPPQPPQPSPPPAAAPKPLDIAPAYDAPKEAQQKDIDSAAADKDHKPPPAPPAPDASEERASGIPNPVAPPTPAPASPEASPASAEPSPNPLPAQLSAQGDTPPPKPEAHSAPSRPAPSTPPAPQPSATPNAKPASGKPAPLFDSLPDIDFGGANIAAPVAGGNASATYTSILVGLFKKHVRVPAGLAPRRTRGAIAFTIDASGRLINRWVAESSGVREMDSAAFEAVGESSPFPRPPPGTVGVGAWMIYY